jgi:outer membrane protein W
MRLPLLASGLLAAAAVAGGGTAARAQTVEITPMGGYRFGGSFALGSSTSTSTDDATAGDLEVADAASFGLHLGVMVSEDGELEILYARQDTRLRAAGFFTSEPLFDLVLETYQFGGNYLFADERARVRPYIGMGLGLTRLIPEPSGLEAENRFSVSFAAGAKAYLGAHFGFRAEVRGFFTVLESESDVFCGAASPCFVRTSGSELSQVEVRGGLVFRF